MLVCMDHKPKCLMLVERETDVSHCSFVTCNNVCCAFTLQAIMTTYISMKPSKLVIVQLSPSYKLLVCRIIPILPITVLAPTIDHNLLRGYDEDSLVLHFSVLLFVCMQEKECQTSGFCMLVLAQRIFSSLRFYFSTSHLCL